MEIEIGDLVKNLSKLYEGEYYNSIGVVAYIDTNNDRILIDYSNRLEQFGNIRLPFHRGTNPINFTDILPKCTGWWVRAENVTLYRKKINNNLFKFSVRGESE